MYMYVPVIVPLLAEGDLNTELHLHVVNLLETPDKKVHCRAQGVATHQPVVKITVVCYSTKE